MDTLTFIAELAKALAWPTAFVVAFLILRKPLRGLIPLLTRLKYKDLELEFGRRLEELGEQVGGDLATSAAPAQPSPEDLAELAPRAAVLEAWRKVEIAAVKRAKARAAASGEDPSKVQVHDAIRLLGKDKGAYPAVFEKVPVLRELRNRAVHAPEFALSPESARLYAKIAEQIEKAIEEGLR